MSSPQIWHPFTQHGLDEDMPEIDSADGASLYTSDGRQIIDAISSWWVQTHGHCHPKITSAIQKQSSKLDQIIFAGWTHKPAEKLAEELGEFLPPELSHIFFSDSGSIAVEVALKMALGYWYHKDTPRHHFITLEHGYHGDTIGAMSVGQPGVFNQVYESVLFKASQIPFPEEGNEQQTLDRLEAYCADSNDPPAALIIEPLALGAGGMKFYSADVLKAFAEICARHDVLLILDEVMTGWGRTGTLFACEQAGIVPDIMCLGKGLTGGSVPLALTACKQHIYDAHLSDDRSKMFFHSSSYTANPTVCEAARANLAVWREEPVQERIDHIIERHEQFADKIRRRNNVRNLRQLGTILAFEVDAGSKGYLSDLGPKLQAFFSERDVLLRPLGDTVYVLPPYCISDDELDQVYGVIEEALTHF